MSRLTLIVAATSTNGIGKGGQLPWHLSKDMAYFARVTSSAPDGKMNAVIMGRKTWESIPEKFRPLSKRVNVVISRNTSLDLMGSRATKTPVHLCSDVNSVLSLLSPNVEASVHRQFVIGGASLYAETLALSSSSTFVDRVLLTRILSPTFQDCDVYMPDFLSSNWVRAKHEELKAWTGIEVPEGIQEENGVEYEFQMWLRGEEGKDILIG